MSALLMDKLSVYESNEHQQNPNLLDTIDNTIKLQLKKPQIWNWELSTSKSSPNIAFPKIQLYNDKGDLLAETQESETVFNNQQQKQYSSNSSPKRYPSSSNTTNSNSSSNDKKISRKNSSSTSSTSVKIKDKRRRSSYADIPEINEELNDFVNYLRNENLNYKFNNNNNSKSITNLYELNGYNDDDVGITSVPDRNYNENDNNSISTQRYRDLNNNNKINKTNRILRRSLSNKLENFSNKINNDYYDNNNDDDKNIKNIIISSSEEDPIWVYSAKGLIQRDMNAKEFDHLRKRYGKSKSVNLEKLIEEENLIDSKTVMKKMDKTLMKEVRFDLKKSKSTTDIITGRDKKKCRRTNSNNNNTSTTPPSKFSKSILERMSASKMGTSTESQDIKISNVNHGPRYFLRTSKAGTLVVCEDNYYNRKTRRRPKSIPRISRNNDENDNEFHCSNNQINNNNKQFYDNAINKLDYLIKNASLKETINSDNLLKVNNENLISQRGKSVEIGLKNKNDLNPNRKLRDIRRCVSAGNVCLSSDEDQQQHQQPKKEIKLRRKRKIHPVKVSKGDQILALNNTNLSSSFKNVSSPPQKLINEKESDELLLCFVQNITSSINEHQQNELQEKNNFINNNISIEDDSILRENDENINFEIIKCSESINNKTPNYIILNNNKNILYNNNNNNNIDNVNYCYPVDEDIVELLSNSEEGLVIIKENMGSNVSRNSSKQQEPYHQSRRRTHSSGDIHNNKYNNSSYYNLLSNNPNDKLNTIPGYDQNNITTTNHQINNGSDKKNRISSHDDDVDTTINHYIPVASDKHHEHVNQVIYKHHYQQHGGGNRIKIPNNYGIGVTRKDRNKFRGSLPNHLDTDIFINEDNIMEQHGINNPLANFSSNSNKNNINQQKTDFVEYVTLTPNKQQIQHQNQENNSPYNHNNNHNHNNSSSNISEKEAASTSSGCGRGVDYKDASRNGIDGGGNSTLNKINQDKPDIQLTLPLARTIFDPSCDQGYGSERSPEDELPQSSILQNLVAEYQNQQQQQNWNNRLNDENQYEYNFITEDCTFSVEIIKGPRGLGLSISGGIDTNTAFPGLIRIKRLFPHQAAWSTGQLQQGDIILDANGISLTGLTNYEALEVLRTMPNNVILLICRPVDEQYKKLSPPTEPPKPPQRTQQQSTSIQTQTLPEELTILYPVNQLDDPVNQPNFIGEFEIFMVKQQGSLGFTLRKEDDSVLGHYVRALVREPATSDGRIKPGDKIVAVNDVPLSPMSHEQAVIFLRQSGDFVKLRLYRDKVQTPIEPVSPTTSEKKTNFGSGKKVILRPEAINLLTDLAHKKQNSLGDSTESSNISSNSSPRRLKRGHKSQSSQSENTDSKSSSNPAYLVSSQTTLLCSDSEQSIDSQCSYIVQPADINESDSSFNGRNNRPQFLNLSGDGNEHDNSGNVTAVVKKPNYQFSACTNTFELNNLDNDALDAPIFNNAPCNDDNRISNNLPPEMNEFTSLPCEALLNSVTKLSNNLKDGSAVNNISHKKNPLYQSVHHVQQQQQQQQIYNQQGNNIDDDDCQGKTNEPQNHGNDSFIKWKDVGLPSSTNENDNENLTPAYNNLSATTTAGENCCYNEENKDKSLLVPNEISLKITEGYKMLSVELNRGWNSRLGFSLQPDPNLTSRSIISAIYGDSVAARDGRLRAGDILVSVNDESVKNMSTSDIIDFLRIIRGAILITVLRKDP